MENALFWLSAVMAVGVLALTWVMRALYGHPGETEHPASDLPDK